MKNAFLLILTFFTLSSGLFAQNGGDWELGLNFTPNSSHIFNKNDGNVSGLKRPFTFGFNAGVMATYYFNENVGLAFGLQYVQNGQRYEYPTILGNIEDSRRLGYLRIPVLVHFHNIGNTGLYARVGPNFDFNVDAKNKATTDIKDKYRTFALGVTGELGYAFRLTDRTRLLLGVQVASTLSNPEKENAQFFGNSNRDYSANFNVGLNLGLNFLLVR